MKKLLICWGVFLGHIWDRNRPQIDTEIELRMLFKKCNYLKNLENAKETTGWEKTPVNYGFPVIFARRSVSVS
ncbi:hypothetical protein ACTBAJ_004188 [Escherichia coli]